MVHHFLINPAAGRGDKTDATVHRILRVCNTRGLSYHIHTTTRPRDATEYVRALVEKPDFHRVYACGGDGTLCEVVNGAVGAENIEVAVIPIGTGNDFVRNFSETENFRNVDRQINGSALPLDLICCNGRYCINMINIGFDCNVVKKAGEIKRSPLVPDGLAYVFGVGITFCKPMGLPIRIELPDGRCIHEHLLLTAIANGRFCGGGFLSNPHASLTDGRFDICAIRKMSRARFLRMIGWYKKGIHLEQERCAPYLTYIQTTSALLTFDTPVSICIDGEIEMTDSVRLETHSHAIRFSVPEGSALLPVPPLPEKEIEQPQRIPATL